MYFCDEDRKKQIRKNVLLYVNSSTKRNIFNFSLLPSISLPLSPSFFLSLLN